ncbi:hypothetical protein WJX74_010285 [Apatococcus lobatus]|uniref:glycerophosphodiester phosphodiesterase n=1 Tax=Apatococcus lobatus TaxID=904363 RepID=A0AAW1QHL1_9CHLO
MAPRLHLARTGPTKAAGSAQASASEAVSTEEQARPPEDATGQVAAGSPAMSIVCSGGSPWGWHERHRQRTPAMRSIPQTAPGLYGLAREYHTFLPASGRRRQPVSSFAASEFQSLRQPGSAVQLLRKRITATGISDSEFDDWNVEDETAGLPTLEEVLTSIPESIGFDLEVKLTTPDDQLTQPEQVDRLVQPILAVVQQARHSSARKMFFSSFDPEVCIALRQRQQDLPVFLLSTGPVSLKPHGDKRRNSVAEAVAFARSAGLDGLVLDSGCFKAEPNAPREAEHLGLTTLTYGLTNNDPDWILQQQQLGVAAVIVDNVPAIVKAVAA